jgi:hypothetical protein
VKLNLGSGDGDSANFFFIRGYDNIDRCYGKEVYPLAYRDESAEEIRASHILEHFGHALSFLILQEWVRVLEPGGILKIAVPDFEWICRQYLKEVDNPGSKGENITGYLMGGQTDENDFHEAIFDRRGLKSGMEAAGLVDIQEWVSEADDCARLPVSLNLQGTKPGGVKPVPMPTDPFEKPAQEPLPATHTKPTDEYTADPSDEPGRIVFDPASIGAVMSAPRLGFLDNMFSCYEIAALGIHLERGGGAFWDQGLTRMMENALAADRKYILTLDYDSVFKKEDVIELYRIMASPGGENIDAIAAMQIRREKDGVLLTMMGEDGQNRSRVDRAELMQIAMPVRTAHFGLTLLRTDALRRLPKPWLHCVPDENGEWGEKRLDSDISFWVKWTKCGNTIYSANHVVIGHAEQVISWPDQNLQTLRQAQTDYQKDGKPKGVWE